MYKYCYVIAVSMVSLSACEFVDGVTIKDPLISRLFAKAESLYKEDPAIKTVIDDLHTQYLCLLASRGVSQNIPNTDTAITSKLESLIAVKK